MAKYDDLSRENLIKLIKEQEEIAHLSLVIAMKLHEPSNPKQKQLTQKNRTYLIIMKLWHYLAQL